MGVQFDFSCLTRVYWTLWQLFTNHCISKSQINLKFKISFLVLINLSDIAPRIFWLLFPCLKKRGCCNRLLKCTRRYLYFLYKSILRHHPWSIIFLYGTFRATSGHHIPGRTCVTGIHLYVSKSRSLEINFRKIRRQNQPVKIPKIWIPEMFN